MLQAKLFANTCCDHPPFVMQTPEAAAIIEETIRFSILTEHEMCGEADAQGAGDTEAFSSHLNVEQMTKVRSKDIFAVNRWG